MCYLFIFVFVTVSVCGVTSVQDSHLKRVCYYTNWSQYRKGEGKFLPENVDENLCTHLIYAFAKLEGNILKAQEWNDESTRWSKGLYERFNSLKNKNSKLRTLLAVGGWNAGSSAFSKMVATGQSRREFVHSTIRYLRRWDFDGLDIDWEYPTKRGGVVEDKERFSLLLGELNAAFKKESNRTGNEQLLLTIAVPADKQKIDAGFDVPSVAKYTDFVNVMTYDLHGAWDDYTGHNSPLYRGKYEDPGSLLNVDWVASYWKEKGVPPEKLIIGFPLYGRGFKLQDKTKKLPGSPASGASEKGLYTNEPGYLAYYEVCDLLLSGATSHWIDDQKVPYMIYNGQWIGYDDTRSFREKALWLKRKRYGGAMVWALPLDDFTGTICNQGVKFPLLRSLVTELAKVYTSSINNTKMSTESNHSKSSVLTNEEEISVTSIGDVNITHVIYDGNYTNTTTETISKTTSVHSMNIENTGTTNTSQIDKEYQQNRTLNSDTNVSFLNESSFTGNGSLFDSTQSFQRRKLLQMPDTGGGAAGGIGSIMNSLISMMNGFSRSIRPRTNRGRSEVSNTRESSQVSRNRGQSPASRPRGQSPLSRPRGQSQVSSRRGQSQVPRRRGQSQISRRRGQTQEVRSRGLMSRTQNTNRRPNQNIRRQNRIQETVPTTVPNVIATQPIEIPIDQQQDMVPVQINPDGTISSPSRTQRNRNLQRGQGSSRTRSLSLANGRISQQVARQRSQLRQRTQISPQSASNIRVRPTQQLNSVQSNVRPELRNPVTNQVSAQSNIQRTGVVQNSNSNRRQTITSQNQIPSSRFMNVNQSIRQIPTQVPNAVNRVNPAQTTRNQFQTFQPSRRSQQNLPRLQNSQNNQSPVLIGQQRLNRQNTNMLQTQPLQQAPNANSLTGMIGQVGNMMTGSLAQSGENQQILPAQNIQDAVSIQKQRLNIQNRLPVSQQSQRPIALQTRGPTRNGIVSQNTNLLRTQPLQQTQSANSLIGDNTQSNSIMTGSLQQTRIQPIELQIVPNGNTQSENNNVIGNQQNPQPRLQTINRQTSNINTQTRPQSINALQSINPPISNSNPQVRVLPQSMNSIQTLSSQSSNINPQVRVQNGNTQSENINVIGNRQNPQPRLQTINRQTSNINTQTRPQSINPLQSINPPISNSNPQVRVLPQNMNSIQTLIPQSSNINPQVRVQNGNTQSENINVIGNRQNPQPRLQTINRQTSNINTQTRPQSINPLQSINPISNSNPQVRVLPQTSNINPQIRVPSQNKSQSTLENTNQRFDVNSSTSSQVNSIPQRNVLLRQLGLDANAVQSSGSSSNNQVGNFGIKTKVNTTRRQEQSPVLSQIRESSIKQPQGNDLLKNIDPALLQALRQQLGISNVSQNPTPKPAVVEAQSQNTNARLFPTLSPQPMLNTKSSLESLLTDSVGAKRQVSMLDQMLLQTLQNMNIDGNNGISSSLPKSAQTQVQSQGTSQINGLMSLQSLFNELGMNGNAANSNPVLSLPKDSGSNTIDPLLLHSLNLQLGLGGQTTDLTEKRNENGEDRTRQSNMDPLLLQLLANQLSPKTRSGIQENTRNILPKKQLTANGKIQKSSGTTKGENSVQSDQITQQIQSLLQQFKNPKLVQNADPSLLLALAKQVNISNGKVPTINTPNINVQENALSSSRLKDNSIIPAVKSSSLPSTKADSRIQEIINQLLKNSATGGVTNSLSPNFSESTKLQSLDRHSLLSLEPLNSILKHSDPLPSLTESLGLSFLESPTPRVNNLEVKQKIMELDGRDVNSLRNRVLSRIRGPEINPSPVTIYTNSQNLSPLLGNSNVSVLVIPLEGFGNTIQHVLNSVNKSGSRSNSVVNPGPVINLVVQGTPASLEKNSVVSGVQTSQSSLEKTSGLDLKAGFGQNSQMRNIKTPAIQSVDMPKPRQVVQSVKAIQAPSQIFPGNNFNKPDPPPIQQLQTPDNYTVVLNDVPRKTENSQNAEVLWKWAQ